MSPSRSVWSQAILRELLQLYFVDKPRLIDSCCNALGQDIPIERLFPAKDVAVLRKQALQLIRSSVQPMEPGAGSCPSGGNRAELLCSWATWAGDPAAHAAWWLTEGAPNGITVDFKLDGVREPIPDETPMSVDELSLEHYNFSNYEGVESDPGALDIIDGYIASGWLKEFNSNEALANYVGGPPLLNKFACVTKTKLDVTIK